MRILVITCLALSYAAAAVAQPNPDGARPGNIIGNGMSLPRSDKASNLDSETTRSELAPNLPAPPVGDDIAALLMDARTCLQTGRTGEAQEALERAETRLLDRSVPYGTQRQPAETSLIHAIQAARVALAAGRVADAIGVIDGALPRAAAVGRAE